MGMTEVTLKIKNTSHPTNVVEGVFIVDSGAAYTVVPYKFVKKLGLKPSFEREFVLADGKIVKRTIGSAIVGFENEEIAAPVVLGQKGDSPLLGALTLEAFGLALDPFKRKLYPARLML